MAGEPDDVGEIQKALNDTAGKASVLWTTFVTFGLYLAIAFGSVTHRDLFLETPIKLPLLNVELPLVGFFTVAPVVLVIFHFYVYLQLLALAKKAKDYDSLLRAAVPLPADRQHVRQRLDSFFVLQFLAGPREQRTGIVGLSLRFIAWITLVGAPVLILLLGQIMFLPYHLESVTWLHRIAIFADLIIIWVFWDPVRSDDQPMFAWVPAATWKTVGMVISVCVVLFSVALANYPGERVHRLPSVRFMPLKLAASEERQWTSLHELLFSGDLDEVSGLYRSLLSNRLVLNDQSFIDPDKIDKIEFSRSFRGRDLGYAVLTRADLRKAVFAGAVLEGAKFDSAQLHGAWFGCAGDTAAIACTRLQGASFFRAQLPGAVFTKAHLEGANFEGALLVGAWLNEAYLHATSFESAELYVAAFDGSLMHGAVLDGAVMQGASFERAEALEEKPEGAQLLGASFKRVQRWRARGRPTAQLIEIDPDNVYSQTTPWDGQPRTRAEFSSWREYVVKELPADTKDDMSERLSVLDPQQTDVKREISAKFWEDESIKLPEGDEGKARLAQSLSKMICSSEFGGHVMRGLLQNGRLKDAGKHIASVSKALKESDCAGAKGIIAADWAWLELLVKDANRPPAAATAQ